MEKGFFLNRIEMHRTGISINQAIIFSLPIFPDSADPPLSLGHPATVRTQFALNFSSLERGEIGGQLCFDEALFRPLCT
jgi:hypothetical protein